MHQNALKKIVISATSIAALSLALFSCKKEKDPNISANGTETPNFSEDVKHLARVMEEGRRYNPYSIKVVRRVKEYLANTENTEVQNAGLADLDPNKFQLYYRIHCEDDDQLAGFRDWYAIDTDRIVTPLPLDSLCLYPELFNDDIVQDKYSNPEVLYTYTKLDGAIGEGEGAELVDTLYIPGEDEAILDYTVHLLTGNVDEELLTAIETASPEAFSELMYLYDNNLILPFDPEIGMKTTGFFSNLINGINNFFNNLFGGGFGLPGWAYKKPHGRMTFTDNSVNANQGIRDVKIALFHFGFFVPATGLGATDGNGNYDINVNICPGVGILWNTFENTRLKLKFMDFTNAGNVIGTIFTSPLPAQSSPYSYNYNQINNLNINYPHTSREAHCALIYNTIQQARDYAFDYDLETVNAVLNNSQTTRLNVYAVWRTNNNNTSRATTTMMGKTGNYVNGLNNIANFLGVTTGSVPTGTNWDLPDMSVKQLTNGPWDTRELRQTIFHEYGHVLHYFRTTNNYWLAVPSTGDYGTSINTSPGNSKALSEGWADFFGHMCAHNFYANAVSFNEYDWSTLTWSTNRNYQGHLEVVNTFNNNFIPRGLFYDLVDGFNFDERDFDNIAVSNGDPYNGIKNVYGKMTNTTYTIQDFRTDWTNAYPNTANQALFTHYGL